MFVGGEFYYDTRWLLDEPVLPGQKGIFLNGGKACLIVISDYLIDHGIRRILLPAYLCPTIVNTLERCGLTCEYYQVKPDLSIDLDDLARKAAGHRAVYFINYFGFRYPAETVEFLKSLKQKGLLLVEDNAQAGFFENAIGDFTFNSMRKFTSYDGGYLVTSLDAAPYIEKRGDSANRRLPVIREYRQRLGDYLYRGTDDHDELERLYLTAEEYYDADMAVAGDENERRHIERLDWAGIRRRRRENYRYLLSLVRDIPGISPVYPHLQEGITPLGLPVYVSGTERDRLFDELGEAGIGLTIHWDGILRDLRLNGNAAAVEMASRMLTLVIDQRWNHKHMDYQAWRLGEGVI